MITDCLFPVAGLGSRFFPATKSLPKEMLPIVNKPLLQYSVEEAHAAGIKHMQMVLSPQKQLIRDYFSLANPTHKSNAFDSLNVIMDECSFSYQIQKSMRGLGDAILHGKDSFNQRAFAVILPDDLCQSNTLSDMIQIYQKYRCCVIAIEEVPISTIQRYGVVKLAEVKSSEEWRVLDMVEKPKPTEAPSAYAIVGRYILTHDVFELIEKTGGGVNGEVQLTDALKHKAKQGDVIAYKLTSRRYDCGTPRGYMEAINSYYTN